MDELINVSFILLVLNASGNTAYLLYLISSSLQAISKKKKSLRI